MNFIYGHLWPLIAIAVVGIIVYFRKERKESGALLRKYWGLSESLKKKVSFYLCIIGMCGLMISLLDLRGDGEKLKANISQQKTVILLDASASMLVEDVRPNRFNKAIFLARHFIRKAAGHEIAVILFSDTHRKLVPFTSDLDLLDARLEALAKKNLSRGGTGLTLAIQESVNYLRDKKNKFSGNLILFTDGEDNQDFQKLNISKNINVAVVGVGTANGGKIPMKSSRGDFQGYMRFGGQEIMSKLDENAIRSIGSKIEHFKYWLVTSYSLPTDNILAYFQGRYTEKQKEGEITIRPVLFPWIVVPSLILWCIGLLLSWGRQLLPLTAFIIFFSAGAQEFKKEIEFSNLLQKMKKGKAHSSESLTVAKDMLEAGNNKDASIVYDENKRNIGTINESNKGMYLNWAQSSLFGDKRNKGLDLLSQIESYETSRGVGKQDEEFIRKIRKNRFEALKQEKKKQKKEQEDKEKEKKEGKDKEESEKQGKDGKPGEKQDKNGKSGEETDKEKSEKKSGKDSKKEKKKKGEGKPGSDKKELSKKKLSAILKQLLSDDKKLQGKLLNTRTRKGSRQKLKNW